MANEKRTLVELSPYGVQLLSVSGRTVTGWIGRGLDAKEAVGEFLQAAEGSPFAVIASKQAAVARGEGDAAGAGAALVSGFDADGGTIASVVVDAATGRAASGDGAWFAVGAPGTQIEEAKEQLAGLGVAPTGTGLAVAAHVGAVAACLQASGDGGRVAIWAPGESVSSLVIVSAAGVEKVSVVQLGQPQVFEAVQVALGLKFKTAAQKLFANEGYDFSAASKKVGEKLAEALAGPLRESGGAAMLHVVGFSAAQSAWLTPALAEPLGLSAWAPDYGAWLSSKGWTLAGDVTLAACAAGVLGAAVQPDAWIVAAAPAAKAAPVKAEPVVAPAPKPVEPVVAAAPVAAPVPAPKPTPVPPKPAVAGPSPAPAPSKAAAPAGKAPAPVAPAKPAVQAAPASKPASVPVPVSSAAPVPVAAPAGKAPATIGGIPVPFIISGVVLSLLVGAGVFFLRSNDDSGAAPVASAQSAKGGAEDASAKPSSSLSDLLAPPPVPGLASKPAAVPVPTPAPAPTPSPSSTTANFDAKKLFVGGEAASEQITATDLIAEGKALYRTRLYEAVLFEGLNMLVVKKGGRTVFSHVFYQTAHAPTASNGKPVWRTLERLTITQTRVKRVDGNGTARFMVEQENSRARAEHEIVCLPDRIDVTTRVTPKDYVSNVQGKVATFAEFNWASEMLSSSGAKMKTNADSVYSSYADGSVVRLVFLDGFSRLSSDDAYKAQTNLHAELSGTSQVRAYFGGDDPSVAYGPLRISVRFE